MAIAKYNKTCAKNTPGNSRLYITEVANIASLTVSSGEITALGMESTQLFREFKVDIDTLQVTSENTSGTSTVNTPTVQALFSKNTKELRDALESVAEVMPCGVALIVLDNNGEAWLYGYNDTELDERPMNNMTYNFDSGAELADEGVGAYTVTWTGTSQKLPLPFDDTLKAAIKGGTATFIDYN